LVIAQLPFGVCDCALLNFFSTFSFFFSCLRFSALAAAVILFAISAPFRRW
jgi:hypothetical protein